MCDPVSASVAMASLLAASTYMQIDAQNKQTDYQNEVANVEQQNAINATKLDYVASQNQQEQLAQQRADESFQRRRAAARERAMLRLSSEEGGLNGSVVTSQFQALEARESMANDVIQNNTVNQLQQNELDQYKIYTNSQSRINQAQSSKRYGVSGLNAGLQIASGSASGAMSGGTFAKNMGW